MTINKKLIHFNSFDVFNTYKLSANSNNTQCTIGINGDVIDETPDIPWHSIVFIKDTQQQWTHGLIYRSYSTVNSVDELNPDAPQGSLASVIVNTVNEVNFSELHQPTSDEVNTETMVVDTTNLSRVNSISINNSYDTTTELQMFGVYLFSKDVDMQGGVGQVVGLMSGAAIIMNNPTQEPNQLELFTPNEDGTITVNEENLSTINNLLSSTEFVYGGVLLENGDNMELSYHPCVDMFYKAICNIQKTDLYIKDVAGWEVLEDDIKKEVSSLNLKVNNFQFTLENLKNTVDSFEDKIGIIVNSVDELPEDAPIGSLASVLYDALIETKISEDVYPNKAIDKFVFRIPEKIEDTTLLTGSTTLLEVNSNTYLYPVYIMFTNGSHLSGSSSSYTALWYSAGSSNTLLANYDSESGDLVYYDETKATNLASSIISYNGASSTLCNTQYVDTFMCITHNKKATKLYLKNEIGWEELKTEADLNGNDFVNEARLAESLTSLKDLLEGALETKQDTLVSGTNIKTINGISLLGSEDITINGGSVYTFNYTGLISIIQEEWDAMQLADVIQLVIEGIYTPAYVGKDTDLVLFYILNKEFLFSNIADTSDFILITISNDLKVSTDFKNKTDLSIPTINTINKKLSLSNTGDIRTCCSILQPWLSMTFMISDSNGNCSSRDTVYIDTEEMKLHLFHSAANEAVHLLFTNGEAYYYIEGFNIPLIGNIAGGWYSQSISKWITLPETPLKTARVGDFITFTRVDVPASDFYSKYINFDSINLELGTADRAIFNAYKSSLGLSSLSDGLFIKYLIVNGYINTCSTNPKTSPSALLYPLAVGGMVTTYIAQITPNTENFYSGEFWTENMTGPGIYSYVTKGRPAGSEDGEFYTGYVSPDGTQTLVSMKDPSKAYTRAKIGDTWTKLAFGVGKNIGGTGEIFNDYTNNKAHTDHAHAEGQKTNAYSYNAHAEGYNTLAGHNAHSEGSGTHALGQNSHAEGLSTQANANGSHAEGLYTITNNDGEHAEGKFNYHEIDNLIHSVGIGNTVGNRVNAHAITLDGKHYIYGIGGYEGKGVENALDLATVINSNKGNAWSILDYEFVDLGLSVRWASCNVGAESPEEFGDYFAWGETTPKNTYSSVDCFAHDKSMELLKSNGVINDNNSLIAAYDAATANWGARWRMSTHDEMKELIDNCTWEWTSVNGINGYQVTGPNSNSIFLPAAGKIDGSTIDYTYSYYWNSTKIDRTSYVSLLNFRVGNYLIYYENPYYGGLIRPVTNF